MEDRISRLEEKIREKANAELKNELTKLFAPVRQYLTDERIYHNKSKDFLASENSTFNDIVSHLIDAMVSELSPKYERKAIDEFIVDFDNVKAKLHDNLGRAEDSDGD